MLIISAEHQALQKGSQGIMEILAKRKKGFTLFSFLEKAAGEAQVKDHIKYMKPSTSKEPGPYKESTVELSLETLTLKGVRLSGCYSPGIDFSVGSGSLMCLSRLLYSLRLKHTGNCEY